MAAECTVRGRCAGSSESCSQVRREKFCGGLPRQPFSRGEQRDPRSNISMGQERPLRPRILSHWAPQYQAFQTQIPLISLQKHLPPPPHGKILCFAAQMSSPSEFHRLTVPKQSKHASQSAGNATNRSRGFNAGKTLKPSFRIFCLPSQFL